MLLTAHKSYGLTRRLFQNLSARFVFWMAIARFWSASVRVEPDDEIAEPLGTSWLALIIMLSGVSRVEMSHASSLRLSMAYISRVTKTIT